MADPEGPDGGEPDEKMLLAQDREQLLGAVSSAELNTVEQRVAWTLNNFPEARDSDIALALRYWETFEDYDGGPIDPSDLYRFARQGTLTRARAHIQNKLELFKASPLVRAQRGTLADEERGRGARAAAFPVFQVYADESGKTQEHLVVGTVWVLHGPESIRLKRQFRDWRNQVGFHDELHFADVRDRNIEHYKNAISLVLANANVLSFKSGTVERAGVGNVQQAFSTLFYHVLAAGIVHESESGRATLPRTFQLWKDAEEVGYDRLLLAEIGDRLRGRFQQDLEVETLAAVNSKSNLLVQIADLFTGSINRIVNPPNPKPVEPGPKDQLSSYLLQAVGWNPTEVQGDMAVSLSI